MYAIRSYYVSKNQNEVVGNVDDIFGMIFTAIDKTILGIEDILHELEETNKKKNEIVEISTNLSAVSYNFV